MNVTIDADPAYAIAYCHLRYGETLHVETDGMAMMSDGVSVSTGSGTGGIFQGLVRKTLGGESFFMGAYTAQVEGAWVAVAPKSPGDIRVLNLTEYGEIVAQSGSVLAFDDDVEVGVKPAGLAAGLATHGLTLLALQGTGTVVLCAYGAIRELDVADGQTLIVDTGHLVGYSRGMHTQVGMLGSVVTATTTGEALVCRIHGPGKVLVQTRAERQLQGWLEPTRGQNG